MLRRLLYNLIVWAVNYPVAEYNKALQESQQQSNKAHELLRVITRADQPTGSPTPPAQASHANDTQSQAPNLTNDFVPQGGIANGS